MDANEAAIAAMRSRAAETIQAVDAGIRRRHVGQPAAAIVEPARAAFKQIAMVLPDASLLDYCQSVSDDTSYHLS